MNLYGYVCENHRDTIITWVDWKAEDAFSVPCCAECGSMENARHVMTVKIDPEQVEKQI